MTISFDSRSLRLCAAALAMLCATSSYAQDDDGFHGQVGLGAVKTRRNVAGVDDGVAAMPFLAFDYGRWFGRIDTFGFNAVPLGSGHLELVAQYRADGFHSPDWTRRRSPLPLGIGTLQVTPFGAWDLHVLHDVGGSGGTLWQARYLAEFAWGPVTVYPELGAEYQDGAYLRYYAGTTALDARRIDRDYRPGGGWMRFAGALVETRLSDRWALDVYYRWAALPRAQSDSPLQERDHRDAWFVALARRF